VGVLCPCIENAENQIAVVKMTLKCDMVPTIFGQGKKMEKISIQIVEEEK